MYPDLEDPVGDQIFSDWGGDRFARGSYSFPGVGSPITDRDRLADVQGLLHFAGEATTRCWGSVNGAFESGQSAASEVLAAKNKRTLPSSRRPAEREGEDGFFDFFGFSKQ